MRADNPMLYYRFEEAAGSSEAADSSTGNHPGTYNDVTLGVQSFNAELGLAAEFDGELSSVSVPALQPAAEFTIEAWIRPNIYSTWNAIYNTEGYPDGAVHFQLIDGNKAEFAMNGNAPEDINFGDNSVFAEEQWTYVAVAFSTNTSSVVVYVNGAPFTTNVYSEVVAGSFESAHIGAWNAFDRQFDGLIDEVAIYPTALNAAQIQAHYRAAVGSFISVVGHPRDAAVFVGGTATFNASANVVGSADAPRFQWQRDGEDIAGATNATYTTPALTLDDDGALYRAVISATGAAASATTREASVSVTDLPPTGYANAVKADSPMVYYRFEEPPGAATVVDSSTGNHPGTYSNVVLQNASYNAVLGGAALFDGSSARVAVPALGAMDSFTIEAWIKPSIYKTTQAIYTADIIDVGAPTVELVDEGGVLLSVEGNDPADMDFGDESLFPGSEWKYLVLTYDSAEATFKAYVDGEQVFEDEYIAAFAANFTAGHLGAGSDVNSYYSGLIDEFALYTNVLSEERILAHWATVTGAIIRPQPQDAAIFSGNTATFTAGVITGFDDVPTFQWQRNGVDISGATNASYTTPVLTDVDTGTEFRAIISAGASTFTTRTASVSVTSLPPFGYRDAVLSDAPIVYYRFEETEGIEATDSSPSGNNGEYDGVDLGQASYNAVLGQAGGFDEASVSLPDLGQLGAFTIEAWIKPDVYEEFNAIFDTEEWTTGSVHFQLIDDEMIALSLNAGPDANDEDQEEDAEFGGSDVLAEEEWRHVAVTYDSGNSTASFYVNGVLEGTHTFEIPPVTAVFENSHIGAWNGDERFFFGLIDEFAIYDKILPAARLLAHYQAAAGATVSRPTITVARNGNQLTLSWT
ncbi:MAG TPA: LamG domain-containing protein, partial [Candidatus Kapabacteria bacterium]|nr:LamG domain-containing protein [Candidatus Kapabacteria bacterium]